MSKTATLKEVGAALFNCGPVYQANRDSVADIVVNQGGTDSGKTYSILQLLFTIAISETPPLIDPIITILSASVPDSKKGAYRIAQSIMASDKVMEHLKPGDAGWNRSDRILNFKNGWIMEFVGDTTEQAAKQGKRQYLFVNEANGITWLVFWQMAKRTRKRAWIDYNPSAPFWPHEKLIGTTKEGNDLHAVVQLIISDHRHNPFLSKKDHDRTENIKDKDLWNVYARGRTGNLIGLIYKTWKQIPDNLFPWKEDGKFGGLDFGYTNDPTAGVVMVKIANNIYIHELCYEPGIAPVRIAEIFKAEKFDEDTPLYCEHDSDMIRQLRMDMGLLAIAARKGPGSIKAGILKVNEYNVYYTASSKNIDTERKAYMWLIDEDTGKATNTPVETNNHLMDAIRYGIYSNFYRQ